MNPFLIARILKTAVLVVSTGHLVMRILEYTQRAKNNKEYEARRNEWESREPKF